MILSSGFHEESQTHYPIIHMHNGAEFHAMHKGKIILVAGKAFAGKSTFSKISQDFLKETNKSVSESHQKIALITTSFSRLVKKMIEENVNIFSSKDITSFNKGVSIRDLMQSIGKSVRAYDVDLFAKDAVNQVINKMADGENFKCIQPYKTNHSVVINVVIDDLRFDNEIDIFKESLRRNSWLSLFFKEVIVVNIENKFTESDQYKQMLTPEQRDDVSEIGVSPAKIDFTIYNKGNINLNYHTLGLDTTTSISSPYTEYKSDIERFWRKLMPGFFNKENN